MKANQENIDRFNDRADNYNKYRPGYPDALLTFLFTYNQITSSSCVLEVGAGTGILSQKIATWGCRLTAMEPNDQMRAKAQAALQQFSNCNVVCGSAENTGLPNESVDLIVCAQAFHWFNMQAARAEFQRILKNGKQVAIIWNMRNTETAFEQEYQQVILKFSIDYLTVIKREERGNDLATFFHQGTFVQKQFVYDTYLTFEQLLGRTLSYSYMPNTGHPASHEMTKALQLLFDQHQYKGLVGLSYHTKLFIGTL